LKVTIESDDGVRYTYPFAVIEELNLVHSGMGEVYLDIRVLGVPRCNPASFWQRVKRAFRIIRRRSIIPEDMLVDLWGKEARNIE